MRALTSVLGNAVYKGRVPVGDGVDAFLFDRDGEGVMVLWSDGAQTDSKELSLSLGENPRLIDAWGNATPLPHLTDPKLAESIKISVGAMPIYIVDVDANCSRNCGLRVAIDSPLIESSFMPHTHKLHFLRILISRRLAGR